jgi:glycosyltransferase involved in cell wall biosynthesis
VLEAMACGLPAVVPDRAALSEAAKGYGVVVDGDPARDEFAEAMGTEIGRLLTDDALRAAVGARCQERGSSFTWENAARGTLDVLRRVASGARA